MFGMKQRDKWPLFQNVELTSDDRHKAMVKLRKVIEMSSMEVSLSERIAIREENKPKFFRSTLKMEGNAKIASENYEVLETANHLYSKIVTGDSLNEQELAVLNQLMQKPRIKIAWFNAL